jgi:hypothetical protein
MANIFQPVANEVNPNASMFTQEGVVDQSAKVMQGAVQAFGELAQTGIDVYKGYVAGEIGEEFASLGEDKVLAAEGLIPNAAQLGKLKQEMNTSLVAQDARTFGEDALTDADKKYVTDLSNQIQKLQKVVELGKMSQTSYDLHVSSKVKQMIAERPWAAEEIRRKALEMTGASRLYANPQVAQQFMQQENEAEMAAKQMEAMRKSASKVAELTGDYVGLAEAEMRGDFGSYIAKNQESINSVKESERFLKELQITKNINDIKMFPLEVQQKEAAIRNSNLSAQEKALQIQNLKLERANAAFVNQAAVGFNLVSDNFVKKFGYKDKAQMFSNMTQAQGQEMLATLQAEQTNPQSPLATAYAVGSAGKPYIEAYNKMVSVLTEVSKGNTSAALKLKAQEESSRLEMSLSEKQYFAAQPKEVQEAIMTVRLAGNSIPAEMAAMLGVQLQQAYKYKEPLSTELLKTLKEGNPKNFTALDETKRKELVTGLSNTKDNAEAIEIAVKYAINNKQEFEKDPQAVQMLADKLAEIQLQSRAFLQSGDVKMRSSLSSSKYGVGLESNYSSSPEARNFVGFYNKYLPQLLNNYPEFSQHFGEEALRKAEAEVKKK